MAETFSPYRDWLGLDGVTSRPDHYRLLGLQPFEADPAVIRAAADRSLNRLRGTSPDGHDREWMQLMRELLEAEESLTEAGKKVEYDQKLRGPGAAPTAAPQYPQYAAPQYPSPAYPPAQPWQQAPNPMDPMAPMGAYGAPPPPQYPPPPAPWTGGYQPNAYPPSYPQPQFPPPAYPNYYGPQAYAVPPPPPPVSNVPDPMAPMAFDAPPVESPYGPPAPPSTLPEIGPRFGPKIGFHTAWSAPEAPAAPPAVAVPVTALAPAPVAPPESPPAAESTPPPEAPKDHRWKDDTKGDDTEKKPKPVVSSKPFRLDEDEAELSEKKLQKMLLPLGVVVVIALFVLITVNAYVNRPKQVAHNPQPPAVNPQPQPEPPKPVPPPEPPAKVETSEEEPMPPKPERPIRRPKPKPEPEEPPAEEMPAKPTPEPMPEPIKPVPPPDPPKPEPMPEAPKREDVLRLAKVLQEARVLVRESKAEAAMEMLNEVEKLPMSPAHRAKWDRLLFLADSVKQCVDAIRRTVPRLEGASTITVGSTVVSIVDGDMQKITVRINGQNRTYNLDELPVGLGIALADMSLDRKEPVNLVIKGAYVVARSSDDAQIAKARGWWQEAISRGISECERLVPVIEDTYELEKDLPRS